jgi:hypothetical protein
MHLPRFEQAEEDCNAALSFDLAPPDKAKALLRRGTARVHLYRGPDALQDFQAVLRLEPNNRQAKEEVQVSGCGCVCVGGGGGGCTPLSSTAKPAGPRSVVCVEQQLVVMQQLQTLDVEPVTAAARRWFSS